MMGFNQTEVLGGYCSIVPKSICKSLGNPNSDVVMRASLLGQRQPSEESEVGGERLVMATEGSLDGGGFLRQRDRKIQTNVYSNSGVLFHREL